jgi:hypothetical protein
MNTIRSAAGVGLLALAACAAPTESRPDGHLDGTYVGHRTIDPRCGIKSGDVTFYVDGNIISNGSRHKRHRLEGTVSTDGQFALHDLSDSRHIEGSITGTMLVATEPDGHSTKKNAKALATYDPLGDNCMWRIEAVRVPNG